MHKRVETLLEETGGNVCIQYIFSSFEELNYVIKYMIAIYLEKEKAEVMRLFSEWFSGRKALKESFFTDLQLDMSNPAVEVEFQRHESWKEKTKLRATPTILVNGYKLPDYYKIGDLQYFTEFDVNIK